MSKVRFIVLGYLVFKTVLPRIKLNHNIYLSNEDQIHTDALHGFKLIVKNWLKFKPLTQKFRFS